MRRHAKLLGTYLGEERGCIEFRKHISWYLKDIRAGEQIRRKLSMAASYASQEQLLAGLDLDEPYPEQELRTPRGRQGSPKRVALPEGWLSSHELRDVVDPAAEDPVS